MGRKWSKMESFHHQKSPSFDRFLGQGKIGLDGGTGDELEESDFFWTGTDNLAASGSTKFSSASAESFNSGKASEKRFGILVALPDEESRKGVRSAISLRRGRSLGRTIPRTKKEEQQQQLGVGQQSAPMNVPIGARRFPVEGEVDDDDEMLPPHEIVAKGAGEREPLMSFSVLEGVGRTLKGRDLRRVRNAVWRQTGLLD